MKAKSLRNIIIFLTLLIFLSLITTVSLLAGRDGLAIQSVLIITASLLFVVTLEILFRIFVRLKKGHKYLKDEPLTFENLYVIPHPYLPWTNRSNAYFKNTFPLNYPLHRGKFSPKSFRTNSWGFVDGPNADRDINDLKTADEIRVVCLGASTTGNYIESAEGIFSYPSELEKMLTSKGFDNLKVINCGVGGYNSADILVRFILQIVEYNPDYIIIYHAYNDIRSYLTPGMKADYSHSRRNIGEVYWKFYLADALPTFKLATLNYLRAKYLTGNVQNSLLNITSRGSVDLNLDPVPGLEIYKRNLQSIIDLALSRKIQIVLSTYCHFLHPSIKDDPLHMRYKDIVNSENKIMRDLAKYNNLTIVDTAKNFPQDEQFFVDSVHFTPKGMTKLAQYMSNILEPLLFKQKLSNN